MARPRAGAATAAPRRGARACARARPSRAAGRRPRPRTGARSRPSAPPASSSGRRAPFPFPASGLPLSPSPSIELSTFFRILDKLSDGRNSSHGWFSDPNRVQMARSVGLRRGEACWRPERRRRRLPGPERGHPRGRAPVVRTAGTRSSASARAGAASSRAVHATSAARDLRILPRGGTILGTSRTNPYKIDGGVDARARQLAATSLDALVAIGGEDTLGVAARLYRSTACRSSACRRRSTTTSRAPTTRSASTRRSSIATEAIDRLHTTAESHNRVMVVEVMGRHAGWIAVMSGIAGGADVILIPEQPIDRRAGLRRLVRAPRAAARTSRSSSSARATS